MESVPSRIGNHGRSGLVKAEFRRAGVCFGVDYVFGRGESFFLWRRALVCVEVEEVEVEG